MKTYIPCPKCFMEILVDPLKADIYGTLKIKCKFCTFKFKKQIGSPERMVQK